MTPRDQSREPDRHTPPTDDDWTVPEGADLKRVRPPETVGQIAERLVGDRRWGERLQSSTLASRWSEIVGAQLADKCQPVRLAGGRLVIRAVAQAWATQLRYLTPQIMERVEEVVGQNRVREVVIVVGPLQDTGDTPAGT